MDTNNLQSQLLSILSKHRTSDFYIGNYIPRDKLSNAITHFPIHRNENVIGLVDCTVFGSCKCGLAITMNGLIWKNSWPNDTYKSSLTWAELIEVGDTIKVDSLDVTFSEGISFNMAGSSMKPPEFVVLCFELIGFLTPKITEAQAQSNHEFDGILGDTLVPKLTLISLFAKFVKSDGAITRNEIAFFEGFFEELSSNDAAEKRIYIAFFNKVKDEDIPIYKIARKVAEEPLSDDEDFIAEIYYLLWEIATVDGSVSSIKKDILKEIPIHLGLHRSAYEKAAAKYLENKDSNSRSDNMHFESQDDYFRILGCTPSATDAELKMAHRRKVSSLHPDKLQSKDLADELLQFATQQVQKINHAYEEIMKHRSRST